VTGSTRQVTLSGVTTPNLRVPVLVSIAIAAATLAGCSQPATSVVGARRDRPASPSPSPSPTTPSPSPTARAPLTVQEWMQDGGDRLITSLNNDFLTFDSTDDDAGLRASCSAVGVHVADGKAYPAIPDGQAQGYWSSMLASLDAAAKDCVAGSTGTTRS